MKYAFHMPESWAWPRAHVLFHDVGQKGAERRGQREYVPGLCSTSLFGCVGLRICVVWVLSKAGTD